MANPSILGHVFKVSAQARLDTGTVLKVSIFHWYRKKKTIPNLIAGGGRINRTQGQAIKSSVKAP